MNIQALIIEDENPARESLEILINQFTEGVDLIGYATSIEEAILKINQLQPQLLFLDIQLGNHQAFELLDAFPEANFEVIFTTAFNEYAVRAFRASAVDYLLKPIKVRELSQAINRATKRIKSAEKNNLVSLSHNRHEIKTLMIPDGVDHIILHVEDIACMQGDGACTYFHLTDGTRIVATKNLGFYEKTLIGTSSSADVPFFRVHNSWIVHHPFINRTAGRNPMDVHMASGHEVPVSRSRKAEFLVWLKAK